MRNNWQMMRLLIGLMRPFAWRVLLALVLAIVTVLSSVLLMMSSAWLISTAALQLGITSLGVAPTMVRMFGLLRTVARYLERLISHDVTFRLLAQIRIWFFERIEPLSPAQLQTFRSGDLMTRLVDDIEELQNVYLRVVQPPVVAVLVVGVTGGLFAWFDGLLAGVLVSLMTLTALALPLIAYVSSERVGRGLVEQRAVFNSHLVDNIQGLADSTAYNQAVARQHALEAISHHLLGQERKLGRIDAVQGGVSLFMVHFTMFVVLLLAIGRVDGVFLATLTLSIPAAFEAITPLAVAAQNYGREMAAARRVFAVIDHVPAIADPPQPVAMPAHFDLTIQHLDFRYTAQEPYIFHDFALDVASGSCLVITGESGAGKSSLVNVLLRFWDYESGLICVGGVDIKMLAHEQIHDIFGVMTQRTHLFNTTIRENIRIARAGADDEAIIRVAQAARLHDFIMSLPDGYDTLVGENGSQLSGGQAQRVALARILLKDAPIWILDEITANLDPITAQAVMETVFVVGQQRTIILITHRLEHLRIVAPFHHVHLVSPQAAAG